MKYLLAILPMYLLSQTTLPEVKRQLLDYVSSGQYELEQWQAVKPAIIYLNHHNINKHAAIVFDIDETLLSNFANLKAYNFGGNSEIFLKNELQANATLITASAALFNLAKKRGLPIFLITGRSKQSKQATIKNLAAVGLIGYKGLIVWQGHKSATVQAYKASARCWLEQQGYHIVISVGDQDSDLVGPCHGDLTIKLPNPFYEIPANQLKKPLMDSK